MAEESHYDRLGISEDSSHADIKSAYRKKCLLHHPDKNRHNTNANEEIIKHLNEAYHVLGDKDRRNEYDNDRRRQKIHARHRRGGGPSSSRNFDPFDEEEEDWQEPQRESRNGSFRASGGGVHDQHRQREDNFFQGFGARTGRGGDPFASMMGGNFFAGFSSMFSDFDSDPFFNRRGAGRSGSNMFSAFDNDPFFSAANRAHDGHQSSSASGPDHAPTNPPMRGDSTSTSTSTSFSWTSNGSGTRGTSVRVESTVDARGNRRSTTEKRVLRPDGSVQTSISNGEPGGSRRLQW